MGTSSYVLTGTARGMAETFGSTCHGAGRSQSRAKSRCAPPPLPCCPWGLPSACRTVPHPAPAPRRRSLAYEDVLQALEAKGISIRVASPKLVMEEAPESYKDVSQVVDTCAWRGTGWGGAVGPYAPRSPAHAGHEAGISSKAVKLRPIAVVKG